MDFFYCWCECDVVGVLGFVGHVVGVVCVYGVFVVYCDCVDEFGHSSQVVS